MSLEAITWAWKQDVKNPTRKLVLMALADYADEGGVAWPSVRSIAEKACCERRTVQRHLQDLAEMGAITVQIRHRENGSQSSSVYLLHTEGGAAESHPPPRQRVTPGGGRESPPDPSVDPSLRKKRTSPGYSEAFEEVWKIHPRGSKKKAWPEYRKAVSNRITHDRLREALRSYVRFEVRDDFKGCHLERWIRDDRWEEQHAAMNGTHWSENL